MSQGFSSGVPIDTDNTLSNNSDQLVASQKATKAYVASEIVALGLGTLATQNGTFSGTSSGTNTGDQTSIVGITGTKAQFDTACTDGNFAYQSDLANYQPLDTQLTDLAGLSYVGNASKVVRVNAGATGFELATVSGTGDVVGPASSVDSEIALFDSTTGKLIKRASNTGMLKASSGVIATATDGTDYYSSSYAIPAANVPGGITSVQSTLFTQSMSAGTYYYLPSSALTMPASSKTGGGMSTSTTMQWDFMMRKTAAGTGAFNIRIYRGTNGTTADTADVTQSIGTATAAVDIAMVKVNLKVTATGGSGSYEWSISVYHRAATAAGFGTTDATPFWAGTVSAVAMNTASLMFGIGIMGTTGTTSIVVSGLTANVDNMT